MTESEETVKEKLEIPAAKIQKAETATESAEPSKVTNPTENVQQSETEEQVEEVELVTEVGTVDSLDTKPTTKSLAQEFFEDKDPFEAEKCRIEILNLPIGYDNKDELMEIFSKYGKIVSIEFKTLKCVHGFIQFENQTEMLVALKAEDRREMPQGFKLSNNLLIQIWWTNLLEMKREKQLNRLQLLLRKSVILIILNVMFVIAIETKIRNNEIPERDPCLHCQPILEGIPRPKGSLKVLLIF
jgi:hypothetical protein